MDKTPAKTLDKLKNNSSDWQQRPDPKASPLTTDDEKKQARIKDLVLVQSWANFGELVIAASGDKIAIVVPGDAKVDATETGVWKDYPIPHIAYADGPTDRKTNESMKTLMTDPKTITFFRYRN